MTAESGDSAAAGAAATPDQLVGSDTPRDPGAADVAGSESTWTHEYVHTRQRFADRSRAMEWFVEASAEYYAARLSHDLGLVNDLEYEWELKSRRVSASAARTSAPFR